MTSFERGSIDLAIALCISPTYSIDDEGRHRIPEPFRPPIPEFPIKWDGVEILLRIYNNDGEVIVDVMPDGQVILYDAYDEDVAGRRFWSSLAWMAENNFRTRRRQEDESGDVDGRGAPEDQ